MAKIHAKICLNSRLRKPCARGLNMKTVRDYASERGISHQAVYQMMATHKNELEPFIVKQGRTRYLTEKAEEVLDHYRNQSTIVIAQADNQVLIEQLKNEKEALLIQLASVQAKLDNVRDQYEELNIKHIELNSSKADTERCNERLKADLIAEQEKVKEKDEQLQNERSDAVRERLEHQKQLDQLETQHQAELLLEREKWKDKSLFERLFKK